MNVLWGVGMYVKGIVTEKNISRCGIDVIVDVNAHRIGNFCGKPVEFPQFLCGKKIDCIIIGSLKYQQDIKYKINQYSIDAKKIVFIDEFIDGLIRKESRELLDEIITNKSPVKVVEYGGQPWWFKVQEAKINKLLSIQSRCDSLEDLFNTDLPVLVSTNEMFMKIWPICDNALISLDILLLEYEKNIVEGIVGKEKETRGTSVADSSVFPLYCKAAVKSDELFNDFRRSYIFSKTVGAATREFGQRALDEIMKNEPFFGESDWQIFLENDLCGSPLKYEYKIGNKAEYVEPNTFAYVLQLKEILKHMKGLYEEGKIKNISEIGIGYGGLCRIICSYLSISKYYLIDLPEVIKLGEKYLNKYNLNCNVVCINGLSDFEYIETDLLISNYAFSELGRNSQEKYFEKVIKKAKAGFMIWNRCSEYVENLKGMSLEEFLERIPNYKVYGNSIIGDNSRFIVWSNHII